MRHEIKWLFVFLVCFSNCYEWQIKSKLPFGHCRHLRSHCRRRRRHCHRVENLLEFSDFGSIHRVRQFAMRMCLFAFIGESVSVCVNPL